MKIGLDIKKNFIFIINIFVFINFASYSWGQQKNIELAEIIFVHNLKGNLPIKTKIDEENSVLSRLTYLKKWKQAKKNRIIIDMGNNHLPGALGKFSSGLVVEDIFRRVGVQGAMLGRLEWQLDFDAMSHLKAKSKIPLPGANLPYDPLKAGPFTPSGTLIFKQMDIALIFYYGKTQIIQGNPRKWPFLGRLSESKNNAKEYINNELLKLNDFKGAILLVTNELSREIKNFLEMFPRLNGAILSREDNPQEKALFPLVTTFESGQYLINIMSFEKGFLKLVILRDQKENITLIPILNQFANLNVPEESDAEILAINSTWSKLYLEQKDSLYGRFSRRVKKDEVLPLFSRLLQDYHNVEWVVLPKDTFMPRELDNEITRFLLNNIIVREEQIYRFTINGKNLLKLKNFFNEESVYWQVPGNTKIDTEINHSIAMPSSLYYQAFLADIVPEESLSIKTWKNYDESLLGYLQEKSSDELYQIPVDYLLAPSPMWRWYWKMRHQFSWNRVKVASENYSTYRPNYAVESAESISLGTNLEFAVYNINHRVSFIPDLSYSRTEDILIKNRLLLTGLYENTSFLLKPYLRSSFETIIDHERVRELYPKRPWIMRNAFGLTIPIWLTKHTIGFRMEKELHDPTINERYGIEYIFDFSLAFLKVFTYVIKSENYVSYKEGQDYTKFGADILLENSLKIALIDGLSLVFSHLVMAYRVNTKVDEQIYKMETIQNDNLKALLMFEKAF